MLNVNYKKMIDRMILLCIYLIMGLFIIKCISEAMTNPFSFDGGMNVQIAQNLVNNFKYATSYDGITLFNPIVQTGAPVIIPVAILFKLFGETFASGLAVNAIYLILLGFTIIYFLRYCLYLHYFYVLLAIILLYGTPKIFSIGFGLYGEIPTLFYFLLALIFLHKHESTLKTKYIFLAGLMIGLGYLTKTVILISIPAFIFVIIFDYLFKRRLSIKRYVSEYVLLPLGFLIPVIIFEIYKLISLGYSVYLHWWKTQLVSILEQAGVKSGYSDTKGFSAKFITHLNLLSSNINLNKAVILVLLVLLLMIFAGILLFSIYIYWRKKEYVNGKVTLFSNAFLVLITVTLSYFGWWLLITPTEKAFYRRIIDGYILLEFSIVILAYLFYTYGQRLVEKSFKIRRLYSAIVVLISILLLVIIAFGIVKAENYGISFTNTPAKSALLDAGKFINSLPLDAEIFGYGWWQAPNVAFISGRSFKNINSSTDMDDIGPKNEKYLVVDFYAYYLAPTGYKKILSHLDNQLVFSEGKNSLYKLNSRPLFSYDEFSDLEKAQVTYSRIDFTKDNPDVFVRNVYVNEKNKSGKWAQEVSSYLFKYNAESKIKMDLWFQTFNKYDQKPIELRIYANKVLVYYYPVTHAGSNKLTIPLENIKGSSIEVSLWCNAKLIPKNDSRELSIFLATMELVK